MKKRSILIIAALMFAVASWAQEEYDVLRYSQTELSGTARGQAMGGAFGALGGDVTSLSVNPAGVAVYRSSEISATMNLSSVNIETDLGGSKNSNDKTKFNFNNLSYVGYFPVQSQGLESVNFSFSYNRLKNFDRIYSASGNNLNSSLTDYIAALSQGCDSDDLEYGGDYDPYRSGNPWLSILGWQSYLINPSIAAPNTYVGIYSGKPVGSWLEVAEKGYIESYDFSVGTNLGDEFYLGLSFSLTDMSYAMQSCLDEEVDGGEYIYLDNYFETDGSGYQVSVGAIWRPFDAIRLGVAYHSPTWYSMTDYYQGYAYSSMTRDEYEEATPDAAVTDYKLQTPYSWVFSAAATIGSKAIVSMDYEIKDYTSMNLKTSNGFDSRWMNDRVDNDFKVASTVRFGAEYRVTPQFSLRAGYAWMENPYEKSFKNNEKEYDITGTVPHYTIEGDVHNITAGFGYRFTPKFYIDAAFVYRTQTDDLYLYPSLEDTSRGYKVESPKTSFKNNTYKGLITLGYKF